MQEWSPLMRKVHVRNVKLTGGTATEHRISVEVETAPSGGPMILDMTAETAEKLMTTLQRVTAQGHELRIRSGIRPPDMQLASTPITLAGFQAILAEHDPAVTFLRMTFPTPTGTIVAALPSDTLQSLTQAIEPVIQEWERRKRMRH
jgi:hypothetical protein